jgi:hypothetical protein
MAKKVPRQRWRCNQILLLFPVACKRNGEYVCQGEPVQVRQGTVLTLHRYERRITDRALIRAEIKGKMYYGWITPKHYPKVP